MTEAEENAAVSEIAKQLEAEGLAAEAESTRIPVLRTEAGLTEAGKSMPIDPALHGWAPELSQPGPLPLSDLRERIAILCAAGVIHYRDAGVELHFDPDAQKRANTATVVVSERF